MDGAENTIGVERGDTAALPPLALPYPLFFSGSFLLIAEWARRSTPPFRAGRAQVEFDTMAGGAAGSGLIPTFAVPRHRGDVESLLATLSQIASIFGPPSHGMS
jgi:hypothetical protein